MEVLKPCPFCGGEAEVRYYPHLNQYDVSCSSGLGCPTMPSTFTLDTKENAIAAWNQRAERTCKRDMDTDYYSGKLDRFSCSNCEITWAVDDGMVDTTNVNYCPNCGAKVVE